MIVIEVFLAFGRLDSIVKNDWCTSMVIRGLVAGYSPPESYKEVQKSAKLGIHFHLYVTKNAIQDRREKCACAKVI